LFQLFEAGPGAIGLFRDHEVNRIFSFVASSESRGRDSIQACADFGRAMKPGEQNAVMTECHLASAFE
jgi:hypothetical protein